MRLSPQSGSFDDFLSAKTFDHLTNAKTHESIRFANFLALKQKWGKIPQRQHLVVFSVSKEKKNKFFREIVSHSL